MANRNYISGSEVPTRTGDSATDTARMHEYLVKMCGQLEYELEQKSKQIESLQAQVKRLQGDS